MSASNNGTEADESARQASQPLSNDEKMKNFECALDKAFNSCMRSTYFSDRCLNLIKEYISETPKSSLKLTAICVCASVWADEDKVHIQDLKALRDAVEDALKRVDGQERFKFPAGLAQGFNQALILYKIETLEYSDCQLESFIVGCEELGDEQREQLFRAMMHAYEIRTEVFAVTDDMYERMVRNSHRAINQFVSSFALPEHEGF